MVINFTGKIWFWRGPAPWYFVAVPEAESADLQEISRFVTYGWGVIPVIARIGKTEWKTALIPKDGKYLVPLKARVREVEGLDEGDTTRIILTVG